MTHAAKVQAHDLRQPFMIARPFGRFDGQDIVEVTLRSDAGAQARIINYGAVVRDLLVPALKGPQRVVLGFEDFDLYPEFSPHFGASPGRVANRIGHGRFTLDGLSYKTDLNERARTTLHGGIGGFGLRPWTIVAADSRSATLVLVSPDGEMGFPGTVTATCTYALIEPATLHVTYTATTDRPTPINLCHHGYFNLDGSPDILEHEIEIAADLYTPTDEDLIPTGEIVRVEGTAYDFRDVRPIRLDTPDGPFHYDINYVLRRHIEADGLARAATVRSPRSGLTLEAWTSEPGVQFYDGRFIRTGLVGLGGTVYGARAGFCLEAQNFPDAVNKPHFPNSILRPGQVSRQTTEYRFSRI